MHKRHQLLLSRNYEFLVMEIPMDPTLEAFKPRKVLTSHDYEQLRTLRHQGRRALARYLLAVLPVRGPRAFQALLESLQEANAQHLVDLLVAQSGADNVEQLIRVPDNTAAAHQPNRPLKTPSDTPLPPGPDPHEYAVRLARNNKLIREFVDPSSISPVLAQNKVISAREADMVLHLSGKNKKWDLILSAVLQRGERAFQAFMAALLQKGYSTMFHTIQETSTVASDTDPELDQECYNTDNNDYDTGIERKNDTTKASQTYPTESVDDLTPGMARKKNGVDADTQTQRRMSEDVQNLPNSYNDLEKNGHSDAEVNKHPSEGENVSDSYEHEQNSARPVTSNSLHSNDARSDRTKDSPTKVKSPSKSLRRRSSNTGNLISLQEEDETMHL
ncbi:hypothetical protein ElyMa_000946500 [Elysia marginata]|uniref:CARD domain-containing protein n=1 Tax=Elysia marginata TaxID=1093978 RepID=A0AAV4HCG9_9GAST|nr:hypothetical protein ElyMa_000946500 [Elysia marginata]